MKKFNAGHIKVMTYMPPELRDKAQEYAASKGLSFCALVRQLLKKELRKGTVCPNK
jgi:hypothetical protein